LQQTSMGGSLFCLSASSLCKTKKILWQTSQCYNVPVHMHLKKEHVTIRRLGWKKGRIHLSWAMITIYGIYFP
jgi:hypothetical protein